MRRITAVFLALLLILTSVPAFATPAKEVLTYGYTNERNREGAVAGTLSGGSMAHFGGPSYSQPLIIDGNRWGGELAGRTVAVTVENNVMYGFVLPEAEIMTRPELVKLEPVWTVRLSGTVLTKSDPTYYEKEGRKYLFIGTYSEALNVVEITDFFNISKAKEIKGKYTTDITSSPLVLEWRGHDIVIASSGSTAKYYVIADPLDKEKINTFYIDCASYGRTSSSPVPVDGGRGFAVGVDQGRSRGQIRVCYLDDILNEGSDGKVRLKSQNARIAKTTHAGVASSPVVDGDVLYFGDTQSNIYIFNYKTGEIIVNRENKGTFSNRSPAVSSDTIYFPAVGEAGENGRLIAVDRHTGKTKWVKSFQSRAQTSPVILADDTSGVPFVIWEGTSDGYLASVDPDNGTVIGANKIAERWGISEFGSGISGAISAAGNYFLISTEQGVLGGWFADSLNFQAVSIDSGIPEGQKAQKGKTYKGSAVFKYDENGSFAEAYLPVGVFYGNKYLRLTDENGNEYPMATFSGSTFYGLGPVKEGESKKVYFNWTAVESGTLTASANINRLPLKNVFDENTLVDNEVSTEVAVEEPPASIVDIRVNYVQTPDYIFTGETVDFEAQVSSNVDYAINTQVVWRVNGRVVKTQNITIKPGKGYHPWLSYTLPTDARDGAIHTVELEVNPNRNSPSSEKSWSNNVGRDSYEVYKDTSEDARLKPSIIVD